MLLKRDVSPQRARFEGAVRVPRIASSVFALSHPTHPGVSFRGLVFGHSVGRGMPAACLCGVGATPMLCDGC